MNNVVKFIGANAIELLWQRTRLNVFYGWLRGGHCAAEVNEGISCSQAIIAALKNPALSLLDVWEEIQAQFGKCGDYAGINQKGDFMFNCSQCCRESSKGSFWG